MITNNKMDSSTVSEASSKKKKEGGNKFKEFIKETDKLTNEFFNDLTLGSTFSKQSEKDKKTTFTRSTSSKPIEDAKKVKKIAKNHIQMDLNEYSSESDSELNKRNEVEDDSSINDEKTNSSLNYYDYEYRIIKTLKYLERKFLPMHATYTGSR